MEVKEKINYESCENCFQKCSHVKSRLVYGNPSIIEKPWLTVIVPTYKRRDLLKEALDSILKWQWHVDFLWDVVVVDNEPDDGVENETEQLIRELDNDRILYYRNSENIRPGDNFNRCFLLARGEWVMMLHDDDLVFPNTLHVMGKLIRAYDYDDRPLGAIAASYVQVEYDPSRNEMKANINEINNYYSSLPVNYRLYKITHNNVKVFAHIGGSAPSYGSTFRKKAVLEAGGFNEDFGISGDLILFYNIENKYSVYSTITPLGYYRWGNNGMVKEESTYRVIKDNYDFREYVYEKSPWVGRLFRKCHWKKFGNDAVTEHNNVSPLKLSLNDYKDIYDGRPSQLWYLIYKSIIAKTYGYHKKRQSIRNERSVLKRVKELNI